MGMDGNEESGLGWGGGGGRGVVGYDLSWVGGWWCVDRMVWVGRGGMRMGG